MKVLVTGAFGYLGGRLCHALLAQGHSVRAFVRPTSDLSSLPHDGALDFAYGDVTNYRSLLLACSGCQIILHTAAIVEPWLPDPSKFFSINVGGLKNVLQAYKETGTIEKIIYTHRFLTELGWTRRVQIAYDVADALNYIHNRSKSSNKQNKAVISVVVVFGFLILLVDFGG